LENEIICLKTELRLCECCGSEDLELMWSSKSIVVRRLHTWEFPVNVSICRDCGFCFSSPSPNNDDLMKYHEDGNVGFKEISLPYSIKERLRILEKYKVPNGVFVEIGGNDPREFHQKCNQYFDQLISIEVTKDLNNKSININNLKESVNVISHYDVLEHVLDVKQFLLNCYRALKRGGVMICEVPNLRLYPNNLLLQEFEHVNHFTISSLSLIAEKIGFNLIEFDDICSRPYGFVAVFKKDEIDIPYEFICGTGEPFLYVDNKKNINEFTEARASIVGGLKQIRNNDIQLISIRKKIEKLTKKNKQIILWGVTDLLRSLLKDYKISDKVIVVDSDPRRKDHLILDGIKVNQPIKCIEAFLHADLLVICAPRYASDILTWVESKTGKIFKDESLNIIGVNSSGKTLR
jgi:predicted SAM-dependent methyltransferase